MGTQEKSVYQQHGYADRKDYLMRLADDYGMDFESVEILADMLGPNEDFDGLVTTVQDYAEGL